MEAWIKSLLISCLLLMVIVFVLKFSFDYLTPFIIAILIASLMNPIVRKIEEFVGIERSFATFIVLLFFISVIFIFITIGISQIYLELNELLDSLPDYNKLLKQIIGTFRHNNIIKDIARNLSLSSIIEDFLQDNLYLFYNAIKEGIIYLVNSLLNFLKKLPSIFSVLMISFIASYFICRDIDKINKFILKLFPTELRPKVYQLEKELISSAIGFLRAELILILISGITAFLGLVLIKNNYALILGLTAAFLDLIPFIGPGLLFIPWIIINMFLGNLELAFKLLVIYTIIAAIRQGVEGKIIGSHLGLHPLVTMIGFYIGYRLLGTLGFIIGPAALVLGKALFKVGIFPNVINFKE